MSGKKGHFSGKCQGSPSSRFGTPYISIGLTLLIRDLLLDMHLHEQIVSLLKKDCYECRTSPTYFGKDKLTHIRTVLRFL